MTNGKSVGISFLKVIIVESNVDTYTTTSFIRNQLQVLIQYMEDVLSDITNFNIHAKTLIKALRCCWQASNDLLTNLFKGYKVIADKTFVQYIEHKQEDHKEGILITPNTLMMMMSNEYKIKVRHRIWAKLSNNECQLLVLQLKFTKFKRRKAKAFQNSTTKDKEKGSVNDNSLK